MVRVHLHRNYDDRPDPLDIDGVRTFVTACPKDYTMCTDAVKTLGKEAEIQVKDVIELLAEALDEPAS
jgi:Fe-S oxidoreductase